MFRAANINALEGYVQQVGKKKIELGTKKNDPQGAGRSYCVS
ncbi:MAG: hypothetical protein RL754_397 [Bacteroidota bacterium]|jgi:hypothetical protein